MLTCFCNSNQCYVERNIKKYIFSHFNALTEIGLDRKSVIFFQSRLLYTFNDTNCIPLHCYYGNWKSCVDSPIPQIPLMLTHTNMRWHPNVYVSALLHQTLHYIDRSVIFPVWQFWKVYYTQHLKVLAQHNIMRKMFDYMQRTTIKPTPRFHYSDC